MAIARQSFPVLQTNRARLTGKGRVILLAAVLSALFGIAAFLLLILRDRSHVNVMVAEQVVGTSQRARAALAAKSSAPANSLPAAHADTPATSTPPVTSASPAQDFSLLFSRRMQPLGPLRVKLLKTDVTKSSYDLSVGLGRRSYSHRAIKLDQPLWIAINRAKSVEIVVKSIQKDRIAGYWNEAARSAQITARKRKKN